MENFKSLTELSDGATALKICHETEQQKKVNIMLHRIPLNSIIWKVHVIYLLVKCQSSYYSISYGAYLAIEVDL